MSKMTFFHLEDNRIAQRVLQNALREMADFISARTVNEADELLSSLPDVDFFIIDYYLEGKTGLAFVRKIRSIDKYDMVPVIILTSTITQEFTNRAMRMGVNESVSKLTQPDALREIVTRHLEYPQVRYIPRPYYEVECVAFSVAKKHFQYCPDIDKTVCADSPEEAAMCMRSVLEEVIFKENKQDFHISEITTYTHRIGLEPDSDKSDTESKKQEA
jgi:CheY-like chemotaxis protein